jgi:hypothetical protein
MQTIRPSAAPGLLEHFSFFIAVAQVSFWFVSPCYVLARYASQWQYANGSNRTGCIHQKLTCASMTTVF